jgi:hypothetical protein
LSVNAAREPELLLALIVTAADAYQRKQPRRITRERLHLPVASDQARAGCEMKSAQTAIRADQNLISAPAPLA